MAIVGCGLVLEVAGVLVLGFLFGCLWLDALCCACCVGGVGFAFNLLVVREWNGSETLAVLASVCVG